MRSFRCETPTYSTILESRKLFLLCWVECRDETLKVWKDIESQEREKDLRQQESKHQKHIEAQERILQGKYSSLVAEKQDLERILGETREKMEVMSDELESMRKEKAAAMGVKAKSAASNIAVSFPHMDVLKSGFAKIRDIIEEVYCSCAYQQGLTADGNLQLGFIVAMGQLLDGMYAAVNQYILNKLQNFLAALDNVENLENVPSSTKDMFAVHCREHWERLFYLEEEGNSNKQSTRSLDLHTLGAHAGSQSSKSKSLEPYLERFLKDLEVRSGFPKSANLTMTTLYMLWKLVVALYLQGSPMRFEEVGRNYSVLSGSRYKNLVRKPEANDRTIVLISPIVYTSTLLASKPIESGKDRDSVAIPGVVDILSL